jgi:hypothetical protein
VLPVGKRALLTHFVRDLKQDGHYKSRLVAGSHKQRPMVDFEETFAPALVCSYRHCGNGLVPSGSLSSA